MHYLLKVALASSILLTFEQSLQANASNFSPKPLSKRIEYALNKKDINTLINLIKLEKSNFNYTSRFEKFVEAFPNAKWSIQESKTLKDGRQSFDIVVTGRKKIKDIWHYVSAKQIVGVKTSKGKILDQEILSEQTIIQRGKKPLAISINIPEAVLTGTTYDFDIVIDKPLGNSMIAGGIASLTLEEMGNQTSPKIELEPLQSGGMFKSIRAPLTEGIQNWAAMLVHPEGLISITKMVRVVSIQSEIEL